jgi:histone H4
MGPRIKTMHAERMAAMRTEHAASVRITNDVTAGLSKAAIVKLCRRAEIERVSADVYPKVRVTGMRFINDVLLRAVAYAEHAGRKTLTEGDVGEALRIKGRTLAGIPVRS